MTQASTIIPQSLAEAIPAIGLRFEKKSLLVGLPENFSNKEIDNALEQLVSNLNITVEAIPVDPEIIRQSIEIAYSEVNSTDVNQINSSKFRIEERVIDIVNSIFENAVRLRSSDVHIEPLENELLVRVRVDGKLENLAALPISLAPAILSRLKVLAKVSIVERRRPQDGQFALEIMGRTMDVRLSTVATLYGEKAALRLLDTHRNLVDLTGLGMPENRLAQLQRMLKAGHGLVISAGPTGSGKTTTMHSALQIVNSTELNVCTIEDPVEYVVPGINHIPVSESAGLTFATQLRALLRQDPDVILVGEIRDADTARIAVQAALAGRLVLTTLHAPNAIGAVYRLFQMGIEPYQVAASLEGVISQRLVRRNCIYCSDSDSVSSPTRSHIQEVLKISKLNLMAGKGCTICRGTGFYDRIGAFQLLEINESIRELISQRPSPTQLDALSRKFGLVSLQEEALSLAAEGLTSVEEVLGLDMDSDE